jgi:biotin operon repressor
MKSHAAKADRSPRLQKLLSILKDGNIYSTARLQSATGSMAVHTDIHELRCNGYDIECRYIGIINGKRVSGYRLEVK